MVKRAAPEMSLGAAEELEAAGMGAQFKTAITEAKARAAAPTKSKITQEQQHAAEVILSHYPEKVFEGRGLVATSLRLPADTIEAMRVAAFEQRCTKSEIARRALDAYLGQIN